MKYEVAKSVGMQFDNIEVLWEYCAGLMSNNARTSCASFTANEQSMAKSNDEEHLLAFLFIQNSSNQHEPLKRELKNN